LKQLEEEDSKETAILSIDEIKDEVNEPEEVEDDEEMEDFEPSFDEDLDEGGDE